MTHSQIMCLLDGLLCIKPIMLVHLSCEILFSSIQFCSVALLTINPVTKLQKSGYSPKSLINKPEVTVKRKNSLTRKLERKQCYKTTNNFLIMVSVEISFEILKGCLV